MKKIISSGVAGIVLLAGLCISGICSEGTESGWENPPVESRLRAYWWWLNGNVTKTAVSRDLIEMKKKGFGGALICDAGGAEQDGNDRVPLGVAFFSPEWREIYKHTLREADKLGLEIGLNIQSGWNLGGPMVTPDDAVKKLVYSETVLKGRQRYEGKLPMPQMRDNYYRDLFVVAYPIKKRVSEIENVRVSSFQENFPAKNLFDGNTNSFWVSAGKEPGEGPTANKPEFIEIQLKGSKQLQKIVIIPRSGYGPNRIRVQASMDGSKFSEAGNYVIGRNTGTVTFKNPVTAKLIRIDVLSAEDPKFPDRPRNVQIAEIYLYDVEGKELTHGGGRKPIMNWEQKALYRTLHFSAPDTTPLLIDYPPEEGEEDALASEVVDLTGKLNKDGTLIWDVPDGDWQVIRFGCTIGDHARVSTCSDNWKGYAIDVFDAGAFVRYWNAVVEPLIEDAGNLAGKTLKYLHTDSWEIEAVNWTPTLREEFRKRRGYDFLPYLPVLTGKIIQNREVSNRFLHDYRRTFGDLAIDNHYKLFKEFAHKHGLQIHPESGGPHAVPIDAQQCLGFNDIPMSEFWARSWRHRIGDANRFFCKQPASAAHTYGKKLVAAEGFTTIGPHWQETIWDNLKPSFDRAACEGMNLLVWHAFVCSPEEFGLPGIQYFAGTHFNPNSTWWNWSEAFLSYINRCQWMLQQGLFVADVCYYYGDHVPNFSQLKASDPAKILPGYDYDVITAEAIIERLSVKDGRFVLPDGMNYAILVLPNREAISLNVLKKIQTLVQDGGVVVGRKPKKATGLSDYPACDTEVRKIADELWGDGNKGSHSFGKGMVIADKTTREVLSSMGIEPDFDVAEKELLNELDYIHRRDKNVDIYFVVNGTNQWKNVNCSFRVADKAPEIWNPVTGERRFAAAYKIVGNRVVVPLEFPPYGSWFVVFREPAAKHPPTREKNSYEFKTLSEINPPWTVVFDKKYVPEEKIIFDKLISWTQHQNADVKYYSGAATYIKEFEIKNADTTGKKYYLDLGYLRELASVRVNGKECGIVWAPPFKVEITSALKTGLNRLEVTIVNFWPNRIIGDLNVPPEKRFTKTNIRKFTKDTPLMESGLFGPVRILMRED